MQLHISTSQTCTYFSFQIIHCDLWTSPIVSFTGFKYYLVIVDDFTHYHWTFPLRNKSDTFAWLTSFYALVLNQFHLSVQSVQCDNGKEFDNKQFRDFMVRHGISFHLSCPHTSSQNGRAECAIRSINDIMRIILFQAHMPDTYWVEALQTTTYLLNRRPSKPINLLTPYQALFREAPHLKIFGCLCYPNLTATTPHKLAPRSAACVFLGYPQDHKGYRCLNLSSRKIITPRHVVFDENMFPVAHLQPNSSATQPSPTSDPAASSLDIMPVRGMPREVDSSQ